ncbi:hypothetical protein EIN_151740 [Entamoeba invadens IP1]|uniref:Uncharacterized protein n=1 Tax=Entamoeba invadens IP1 TaxID=370355 RepID=A0A0A1U8S5_ENTIV|nr:hypothetical protein EIN_151740 [Entamoeba invadens IP1]ELP91247.1 hypothetical protein EIN_151740 [Entamoeba invadens IP1]|eukprot:XP_004258018.1 hypothetical protein EIN_151740 [Entamoeba invadens IP1]
MGHTKPVKKIMSYHDQVETVQKESSSFLKDLKTVPQKESAVKNYVKKLEKVLTPLYSSLNIQIKIETAEDQIAMLDCLFSIWRVLLDCLSKLDHLVLPSIFFKFVILLINRREIQPHHLIVNNPMVNATNKPQYYKAGSELRKLLYETFYTISDVLLSKHLVLLASMELCLKVDPKKTRDASDKSTERSSTLNIKVKDFQNTKINLNVDTFVQLEETLQVTATPLEEASDSLEASLKVAEGTSLSTNENRRQSVLSRVIASPMQEISQIEQPKKSRHFSSKISDSSMQEDEFFCENDVSPAFIQFFPQVLAFLFFQIPEFREDLLELVKLPQNFKAVQFSKCFDDEERQDVLAQFPRIFGFDPMHLMLKQKSNDISERMRTLDKRWMQVLLPKSDVFMAFYFHYTKFIYFTVKESDEFVDYGEIFGLSTFVSVYIYQRLYTPTNHSVVILRENDKRSLLLDHPTVINYMIRSQLNQTNLFSFSDCDWSVFQICKWLNLLVEHKRYVTDTFCIDYLISSLDKMFQLDNHKLIISIFKSLFSTSPFFVGKFRIKFFQTFFLEKYFYTFFCHWNSTVRQFFHHFLLYRFVLLRRSHMNWAKYDKVESSLIKKCAKRGTNLEATDRAISQAIDNYVASVRKICDDPEQSSLRCHIYYHYALDEYDTALKLYNEWDKSNTQDIPKIKSNFNELDLEGLN